MALGPTAQPEADGAEMVFRTFGSRAMVLIALLVACHVITRPAGAQATNRSCVAGQEEQPGPACLMTQLLLGHLPGDRVYWQLHAYPDFASAQRARTENTAITAAFGRIWLFSIGPKGASPAPENLVAEVGPITVESGTSYDAKFLKSTFSPGMQAPVHVHSGPEAFYAVSGDTCLETPDGVQVGHGPGNSLVVRAGPPMLLMAPGPEPRRGFALILHDHAAPPTTLVSNWTPKGLCRETPDRH